MKYAMEHTITRDIMCETNSAIETLCYFTGYLVAHVPQNVIDSERSMWVMVEIPHRKPSRPFKLPRKLYSISVNVMNGSLGMLTKAVYMCETTTLR